MESEKENGFASCANPEIKAGLEVLPNWKEVVLMSILIPYYNVREFESVSGVGQGLTASKALLLFGFICYTKGKRMSITIRGKQFVKWAIDEKILTPQDGIDFIIKHGGKFGRRIMYDIVFASFPPEAAKP